MRKKYPEGLNISDILFLKLGSRYVIFLILFYALFLMPEVLKKFFKAAARSCTKVVVLNANLFKLSNGIR